MQLVLEGLAWRELAAAADRRFEWQVSGWVEQDGGSVYLEGVIDAAHRTTDGWHLIDWKTDDVTDEVCATREMMCLSHRPRSGTHRDTPPAGGVSWCPSHQRTFTAV